MEDATTDLLAAVSIGSTNVDNNCKEDEVTSIKGMMEERTDMKTTNYGHSVVTEDKERLLEDIHGDKDMMEDFLNSYTERRVG